jgi:hypothetical protein
VRDYWVTQYLLSVIGWGYLIIVLIVFALVLWLIKGKIARTVASLIILGLASILPIQGYQEYVKEKEAADAYRARLEKAQALFDERCKTAGEKIYKTVDGVDGLLLMKVRQYDTAKSSSMMAGAAAAHEFFGDGYIRSFLLYEREEPSPVGRSLVLNSSKSTSPGYQYVDVLEPADQKRYRYTLAADMRIKREEAKDPMPRFGVTFEDDVNPDERRYWIAKSTVKVIDLKTQETLGEFIRYVIEPGQGSQAAQRTPWLFAEGCNMKTSYGNYSARLFADQVLKPTRKLVK